MTTLYAVLDSSNKAVNFVEFEDDVEHVAPEGYTLVAIPANTNYGHDWTWDGNKLIAPLVEIVMPNITAKQCRIYLYRAGLLSQVNAMIAQQSEEVQLEWQYSEVFERDNPLLNQLAPILNLTPEMLDQFFIEAAQIT